jgi:hypothetical protein
LKIPYTYVERVKLFGWGDFMNLAFAFPVLAGKLDVLYQFAEEFKTEDAREFQKCIGGVEESWHIQNTPTGTV